MEIETVTYKNYTNVKRVTIEYDDGSTEEYMCEWFEKPRDFVELQTVSPYPLGSHHYDVNPENKFGKITLKDHCYERIMLHKNNIKSITSEPWETVVASVNIDYKIERNRGLFFTQKEKTLCEDQEYDVSVKIE